MSGEQAKSIEPPKPDGSPLADHNPDSTQDGSGSEKEIGGRPGLDPTRYGDWEKNGRCIDF
ncbi:MAG: DUF1674 domain-containing protein [Gammaproteobacteria bacterium]|nr:DUF1674 domain-containing protein [Gammaproteobacteria bacterium]